MKQFSGRLYAGRLFAGRLFRAPVATQPPVIASPGSFGGAVRRRVRPISDDDLLLFLLRRSS